MPQIFYFSIHMVVQHTQDPMFGTLFHSDTGSYFIHCRHRWHGEKTGQMRISHDAPFCVELISLRKKSGLVSASTLFHFPPVALSCGLALYSTSHTVVIVEARWKSHAAQASEREGRKGNEWRMSSGARKKKHRGGNGFKWAGTGNKQAGQRF